jgi:hypothetical protein
MNDTNNAKRPAHRVLAELLTDDTTTKWYFSFVFVFLLLAAIVAHGLVTYGVPYPEFWRALEGLTLAMLASFVGVVLAYAGLRRSSAREQRRLVGDVVAPEFRTIRQRVDATRNAVLASAGWKENVLRMGDVPYDKLFAGAKEVGLVVQGWDKWPEDQSEQLRRFLQAGGNMTVILHDPGNADVLKAMGSRWKSHKKDCVEEIANTVTKFKLFVPEAYHARLHFRRSSDLIWYCLIRFEYDLGDETTYVISPYAHKDFPVRAIPALIVKAADFPSLADFFDREWEYFASQPELEPSKPG